MIIRALLFLVLMSYSLLGLCAEEYILLGQWSRHDRPKEYYNQTHHLIGYERNNYTGGYYINSDGDPSWYGGYVQKFNYGLKLTYVAIYGYENMTIIPLVIPGVTIGRGKIQLDLNYVPMTVLTAGFRIKFN